MEHDATASDTRWEHSSLVMRVSVVLAILRYAIPIATLFAIPGLLADDRLIENLPWLTFLRPGKESLLLAGARLRIDGGPSALLIFLAYVPLGILATAPFFLIGRGYGPTLLDAERGGALARAIPPSKVAAMQRVLERRGPTIAILGRIAALPPTILAAAAGASKVSMWRYLVADAIGGVAAFVLTYAIGYGLGETYQRAGRWPTIISVIVIWIAISIMTSWLQRETELEEAAAATAPDGAA